jgi:hypothetical protein
MNKVSVSRPMASPGPISMHPASSGRPSCVIFPHQDVRSERNLRNPAGNQSDAASAGGSADIDFQARCTCLSTLLVTGASKQAILTKQTSIDHNEVRRYLSNHPNRPESYDNDSSDPDNLVPSIRRTLIPSLVVNCRKPLPERRADRANPLT